MYDAADGDLRDVMFSITRNKEGKVTTVSIKTEAITGSKVGRMTKVKINRAMECTVSMTKFWKLGINND